MIVKAAVLFAVVFLAGSLVILQWNPSCDSVPQGMRCLPKEQVKQWHLEVLTQYAAITLFLCASIAAVNKWSKNEQGARTKQQPIR